MKYTVVMQFIPGSDQIWVQQIDPNGPVYVYDNSSEAEAKAQELQAADSTVRKYKVMENF